MGQHVQWIVHKGKKMLFVNVAGLREAEYIAARGEMKQEPLKERNAAPAVLVDLTNTEMTQATVNRAKDVTAALNGAGLPFGPNALVGRSRIQKSVADLSMKRVYHADCIDDAKDRLAKEGDKRLRR